MTNKGIANIFILIGILVAIGVVSTLGYFYIRTQKISLILQTTKETATDEWIGLLATRDGLAKINSQGQLEKDSRLKAKTFVPPGFVADRLGALKLLQNGSVVSLESEANTIYTWGIATPQDPPKPFFAVSENKKIASFAISPDNKQIAIISVTATDAQLQEELRTVSIYEIPTGKVAKTLKLKLLSTPASRTGAGKLLWNKAGLFVLDESEITLFNPDEWQIADIIPDIETGAGPLRKYILISPDGSKYYNPLDPSLAIKKIPGGEILGKVDAPEIISLKEINEKTDKENRFIWVGPAVFSDDSKKLLIQMRSINQNNFMIWEFDTETGNTQQIGNSNILDFGLMPKEKNVVGVKSFFLFLAYSPLGDKIIFAANYPTLDHIDSTDLYQLKRGQQKADFIDFFSAPTIRSAGSDVSFLGWYLSHEK